MIGDLACSFRGVIFGIVILFDNSNLFNNNDLLGRSGHSEMHYLFI